VKFYEWAYKNSGATGAAAPLAVYRKWGGRSFFILMIFQQPFKYVFVDYSRSASRK